MNKNRKLVLFISRYIKSLAQCKLFYFQDKKTKQIAWIL